MTHVVKEATKDIDLEAYLQRIGYTGPRTPTLETLQAILIRHTETIAFENLNPFLRWPVALDLPALQQKLVRDGRGGYCFEQNLLLSHVLKALGFQVTNLAARVLWSRPEDAVTPRSHMLLRVDLNDQTYIVDVGFGGLTLTGALRLEPDVEQTTPHEPFRLVSRNKSFFMQARVRGEWQTLYRFDLQEQFLPDYEVTNWYLSNHPESHFITGLIAARPAADRRYALRNNELAVHHLNGPTERRILTSIKALRTTLETDFRLTLPEGPELDQALQRVIT